MDKFLFGLLGEFMVVMCVFDVWLKFCEVVIWVVCWCGVIIEKVGIGIGDVDIFE